MVRDEAVLVGVGCWAHILLPVGGGGSCVLSVAPQHSAPCTNTTPCRCTQHHAPQAQAVKDVERTTNHDVKAIEYVLKDHFKQNAELHKVCGCKSCSVCSTGLTKLTDQVDRAG